MHSEPLVPESLIDSITGDVFVDPVNTADGHTYSRAGIERWLADHDTSPLTGLRLPNKRLIPNHALRNAIEEGGFGKVIAGTLDTGGSNRPPLSVAAPENPTDVYIRKICPGDAREPHLISMNAGELPTNASVWHLVPESELEAGHTVECHSCRRRFTIARDQAESVDATL